MVRWVGLQSGNADLICVGTNRVMDVQPFGNCGVTIATQDRLVAIYDASGQLSQFPNLQQARRFPSPMCVAKVQQGSRKTERAENHALPSSLTDMSPNLIGSVRFLLASRRYPIQRDILCDAVSSTGQHAGEAVP
jgi:hypothetical protein